MSKQRIGKSNSGFRSNHSSSYTRQVFIPISPFFRIYREDSQSSPEVFSPTTDGWTTTRDLTWISGSVTSSSKKYEAHMSGGWVFFIGGLIGLITVARAKNFGWSNSEFLESEDDVRERVPMTSNRRIILLLVCLLISAFGVWQLEREHAWNPFTKVQSDRTQHK